MFRHRFWWSLLLTVPVVVTSSMVMNWFGYEFDFPGIALVGPVLGSIIFWWAGWPFLTGGWHELHSRRPGMMLLITMAITVAYAASLTSSLDWFDLEFWWELAALITIMLLGHWQEMKALGQAQSALAALAELLPDEGERFAADGEIETVSVDALAVGDVVLVRPGGRVPADGVIDDGEAALDESMVTGESRPVTRRVGDRVVAGTVSTDSSIRVRVTAVGQQTILAGIQRLVAEAQESHSRAQALADRFAALLFYVAVAAAAITFVAWSLLGDMGDAVTNTVTVLVVACPHALGLAIPLVISLSTATAARNGILIKNRLALESMRTVDTILFDKTGTLTRGEHAVTGIIGDGIDDDDVLRLAAGVEATVSTRSHGPSWQRPSRESSMVPVLQVFDRCQAAVSPRSSTALTTRSAGRRCCASATSTSLTSCGRRSNNGKHAVRQSSISWSVTVSSERWRSKIRSEAKREKRWRRCAKWGAESS